MKKLLALLLTVAMLFSLSACGKKKNTLSDETLEGTWEMTIDLNALIDSGVMSDMPAVFEMMNVQTLDLKMVTDVTFEDGTMAFVGDGMARFYESLFDALLDWMAEGDNVYEMMAQADSTLSAAEYKAQCEADGLSKDAALAQITAEFSDSDAIAAALVEEMGDLRYALDGNTLYTWNADEEKSEDEYFQIFYKNNTITVHKVVSEGETTELNDGDFVFVKK